MELDHFENQPTEITVDILSRLDVKTIMTCKSVSKPWLNLVKSPGFANLHLSKSIPGVVVSQITDTQKKYRYLVSMKDRHAAFNFGFPKPHRLLGSANGLLFLIENSERPQNFYICNPITRNYISVPCPRRNNSTILPSQSEMGSFGFGVSKTTGEYKLVKVHHQIICSEDSGVYMHSECEVYTLGEQQWRSVAPSKPFTSRRSPPGLFLNGNLYWLDVDSQNRKSIHCFDLETERFSTLSPPPCDGGLFPRLCIMEECLCYCYDSANFDINIWFMTEDGGEISWKQSVISKPRAQSDIYLGLRFHPITDLKEGDILMGVSIHNRLLNYSNRSKVAEETDLVTVDEKGGVRAVRYTPSFVSLEPFSRGGDLESF